MASSLPARRKLRLEKSNELHISKKASADRGISPAKPWMQAWPEEAKRATRSNYDQQQQRYAEAMRLSRACGPEDK